MSYEVALARMAQLQSLFTPAAPSTADVLIPLSTSFERSGTFCNFEGRPNRFDKVFEKPASAQHAAELFARLSPGVQT